MSAQQREDVYKWIVRGSVLLCTFFLSQLYFTFRDVQAQTSTIKVQIESLSKDIEYVRKNVDKINNDFYKPSN